MGTSIVMPIYQFNTDLAQLGKAALESLSQTEGELEYVLIDNASEYGAELIRDRADVYVRNKKNEGYCKAVNQGFKLSSGDLIAVVNNDTKISQNWLQITKSIFASDPKIGTVHFKMANYDEPFNFGSDIFIGGKERWCHASFYVIRREAIPEGGYWEGYREGGFDDWDFFHRMRDLNGWKQAYTNMAIFQHRHSSTYIEMEKMGNNREKRDLENRELYKKRFGAYPEEQFDELFPGQRQMAYMPFP